MLCTAAAPLKSERPLLLAECAVRVLIGGGETSSATGGGIDKMDVCDMGTGITWLSPMSGLTASGGTAVCKCPAIRD